MLSCLFIAIFLHLANASSVDADQERRYIHGPVVMPSKEEFKNIMLNAQNDARKAVKDKAKNMPMLEWNDGLAKTAEAYSKKCVMRYNRNRGTNTGENLFLGSVIEKRQLPDTSINKSYFVSAVHGHWDPADAVKAWVGEKKNVHSYADLKNVMKVGHYTQIIWADTTKVGCGFSKCDESDPFVLVVCDYRPQGNMDGNYPYQRKTTG